MPTLCKSSGIAGLPEGVKEAGRRVDFRPDDFTLAIETKGYRIAWSRASYCPCAPINEQTEQPDPNCTLCHGTGWFLFAPYISPDHKITGELDTLQKTIVGNESGVIMGIMSAIYGKENPYDQVVRRLEGQMNLTVRPENRLGYHDRITNLDTTIVYSQVADADGTSSLNTRYPIVCMNSLRSESTVFVENTDFTISNGAIQWNSPPAEGERLAMHYLTYPTWRVIEHPHFTRATLRKFKTAKPATPLGDPEDLPVQAICKYEFLL